MVNFTFQNPTKLIFGKDRIKEIGQEVQSSDCKKVLLIAGGGSIKKNGVYEQVSESLKENNIEFVECWGVQPNPTLEKAKEIIMIARTEEVDAILAVGGGSVIDTAKTVAVGFFEDNIWSFFEGKSRITKALPIFTVLTLSATGSEMNGNAVITNEKEKKKWHISDLIIYPKVSIVDPTAQKTLPWKQTANGASDAMAHTMEYYFTFKNEEMTLSLDESIMKTIIKVTDDLKKDENNYEARASLAWAATLALNDISGSMSYGGDWSTHTIEHGLSAHRTNIAHGSGLAIIFPAWILYTYTKNEEIYLRWAKNVWNANSVKEGVSKMKEKYREWNLPLSLSEIGIKEEELELIANLVSIRGTIGAVKRLEKQDILEILKIAF